MREATSRYCSRRSDIRSDQYYGTVHQMIVDLQTHDPTVPLSLTIHLHPIGGSQAAASCLPHRITSTATPFVPYRHTCVKVAIHSAHTNLRSENHPIPLIARLFDRPVIIVAA